MNTLSIIKRIVICNIYLRIIFWHECRKLKIDPPKLALGLIYEMGDLGFERGGVIGIDIMRQNISSSVNTIRHELRHHWQKQYRSNTYRWCALNPCYSMHGAFYKMCPIEMDARYYAKHKGKVAQSPIDAVPLDKVDEAFFNGTFFDLMNEVSRQFGNP